MAAIRAGCDVVLLCNSTVDEQVEAIEALIHAAESGELPQKRLDDALVRQRRVKERFAASFSRPAADALDVVGCARAPGRRRARWRRGGDDRRTAAGLLKFRPVRPGSRVALVAPASPFDRDGVRGRRRRTEAPRPRAGVRRDRVRAPGARRPAGRSVRADALMRGLRRHGRRCRHRGARRLRQRRGAAAARRGRASASRGPRSSATATSRRCTATWASIVGLASVHGAMIDGRLAKGRRRTTRVSFLRSLSDEPLRELPPDGLEVHRARRGVRAALRRHADAARSRRSARPSSSGRRSGTCCSSRKWASGRTASVAC